MEWIDPTPTAEFVNSIRVTPLEALICFGIGAVLFAAACFLWHSKWAESERHGGVAAVASVLVGFLGVTLLFLSVAGPLGMSAPKVSQWHIAQSKTNQVVADEYRSQLETRCGLQLTRADIANLGLITKEPWGSSTTLREQVKVRHAGHDGTIAVTTTTDAQGRLVLERFDSTGVRIATCR